MPSNARGTFDVHILPQAHAHGVGDASIGRFAIDKHFHGDLEAMSLGQMLAVQTAVPGSAGYVAMERATGRLHGRQGTFALQHSGTLDHGAAELTVTVVPNSGTGELAGLRGRMQIIIADGAHSYDFEYTLEDA